MTPPDSGASLRCPHGCSSRAACPYCTPHGTVTPLTDSGEREQRILAALEDSGVWSLADELRARLPDQRKVAK